MTLSFAESDRLKIAVARDGFYSIAAGPNVEPHQRRPPPGRQQRLQPFGICVNEDEAEDVKGVGAGVKPDPRIAAGALHRSPPPPDQFVDDSPLEGTGFEPSVPLCDSEGHR
jgi:hypothetical protein